MNLSDWPGCYWRRAVGAIRRRFTGRTHRCRHFQTWEQYLAQLDRDIAEGHKIVVTRCPFCERSELVLTPGDKQGPWECSQCRRIQALVIHTLPPEWRPPPPYATP